MVLVMAIHGSGGTYGNLVDLLTSILYGIQALLVPDDYGRAGGNAPAHVIGSLLARGAAQA